MAQELTWRDNPWLQPHLDAEMPHAYGEYTPKMATAIVENEFATRGGGRYGVCEKCGATTWYRPTVGAYVCPGCRDVRSTERQWAWEDGLMLMVKYAEVMHREYRSSRS